MERKQIVTTITAALIGTAAFQESQLNNEALVNDASTIADLILADDTDYENRVVTDDDESAIEEIENMKRGIVPARRNNEFDNNFIEED